MRRRKRESRGRTSRRTLTVSSSPGALLSLCLPPRRLLPPCTDLDLDVRSITHWQHPNFYAYFPANVRPLSLFEPVPPRALALTPAPFARRRPTSASSPTCTPAPSATLGASPLSLAAVLPLLTLELVRAGSTGCALLPAPSSSRRRPTGSPSFTASTTPGRTRARSAAASSMCAQTLLPPRRASLRGALLTRLPHPAGLCVRVVPHRLHRRSRALPAPPPEHDLRRPRHRRDDADALARGQGGPHPRHRVRRHRDQGGGRLGPEGSRAAHCARGDRGSGQEAVHPQCVVSPSSARPPSSTAHSPPLRSCYARLDQHRRDRQVRRDHDRQCVGGSTS